MMLAGADAVEVGTATFRDPRAPARVLAGLQRWCRLHDVGDVRDLVGAVHGVPDAGPTVERGSPLPAPPFAASAGIAGRSSDVGHDRSRAAGRPGARARPPEPGDEAGRPHPAPTCPPALALRPGGRPAWLTATPVTGWPWRSTWTTWWWRSAWPVGSGPGSGWRRWASSSSGRPGPRPSRRSPDEGYRVFLDLKLHDIPTTVSRAARVLGGLGVAFATVHTQGGEAMMRAAVSGMAEGASAAGAPTPCVLGVTVLTSDTDAPPEALASRSRLAAAAGCGGLVCAAVGSGRDACAPPRGS